MRKIILLALNALLACSSSNKYDSEKLCRDFCELNKNNKFSLLFEVSTGNRFTLGKPTYIAVYCPYVKGFYINIPLKVEELSVRRLYKSEYFYRCKNGGKKDIGFYKGYIKNFDREYEAIKIPDYCNNKRVLVEGNPRLGRFIEFTLNDKCTVYYLEDVETLTPYWKDKFDKLKKIDKKWYCGCIDSP